MHCEQRRSRPTPGILPPNRGPNSPRPGPQQSRAEPSSEKPNWALPSLLVLSLKWLLSARADKVTADKVWPRRSLLRPLPLRALGSVGGVPHPQKLCVGWAGTKWLSPGPASALRSSPTFLSPRPQTQK